MPDKESKLNRSDHIYILGGQACGWLCFYLSWGDGFDAAALAAVVGALAGSALLMIGLILTGKPPSIFTSIYASLYRRLDK